MNNYFKYSEIEFDYDIYGILVWIDKIINISSQSMNENIAIKFYDINKQVIGEHQRYELTEPLDYWNLEPGVTEFTMILIDAQELNSGKSLSDIMYYSIENLK